MGNKFLLILLWIWFPYTSFSQATSIRGSVVDGYSLEEISSVKIIIEGTFIETETDANGVFLFYSEDLPEGNQVLVFTKSGYARQRIPVVIAKGQQKDLSQILLTPDISEEQRQIGIISLSDNELNEEEGSFDNLSGLLQASRDVFLNAAAFDFSATFFRPRGFDSDQGKLLINGIEMNKIFNGRPQWSNWGGLNDVQRTQIFSMGISPSEVSFGGLAGTTNIIMRASEYGEGGRISYAASNRSYTGRVMATYNSGELPAGWAYSLSISRRFAKEGYVDGTLYDANSVFLTVEKDLSRHHSLNFTAFYTPNIRGKSSANTQEVFDLKGRRYNSFWGYQDNEIRNSRLREIKEPVFMLNHYWQISDKIQLNNNISYQFGSVGNSRIDFGGTNRVVFNGQESFIGGGANPDPAYYQKLPGYFLRFEDNANYEAAYRAQQQFADNGQIDWPSLYSSNLNEAATGGNSIYVIAEDRNDDQNFTTNSILTARLKKNIELNAKISYTSLKSENFAAVKDLLGGTGYLDIDFFAEGTAEMTEADAAQSDLLNRNRIVTEGDRFKYNYELFADVAEAFAQIQYKLSRIDFFVAGNISQTSYQRNGLFQNGTYAENSFGKSEELYFTNFGIKSGATYKLSGRHLITTNLAYYTKAPNLRNSFSNSRQNNETVVGLESEQFRFGDLSYRFRSPKLNLRLTGYYADILDATEISFYYADGLSGLGRTGTTAFVQEVLTGISKQHLGIELGAESQITSTIKLKAAAALGQFIYANNPNLYLTSSSFDEAVNYGTSYLKNYRIPGGPQRAAQLGFEYRDPDYWWFGTTVNFFSHGFADVSPLTRTANFRTDADGLPILSYDENIARRLLKQEQFEDYMLVNVIGGKSWRIKDYYLGFFCSLNNIFDVLYKTGGYEQSRNANFLSLKEDRERDQPLFASRYWYGNGSTYYINFYLRF
ncbi:carboxypeptidase-like regulatory domain-containing protein [Autumnicola psychrophila]|uniref:Carboxypeptidase-like regulatory domain-containing protein n=1 Tax=Autumnicola psychrophila TaxID=3075592 RepID=A0ABU3DNS7_9FLAO|nr:carboxypeptidase-like regulatory domain-containing protein [Zunongwangia sp. F225]MDT0685369.1 carboxypeptidase-like regulatory domain-containing protein [Zunongwangia sp. F225]